MSSGSTLQPIALYGFACEKPSTTASEYRITVCDSLVPVVVVCFLRTLDLPLMNKGGGASISFTDDSTSQRTHSAPFHGLGDCGRTVLLLVGHEKGCPSWLRFQQGHCLPPLLLFPPRFCLHENLQGDARYARFRQIYRWFHSNGEPST